MGKMNFDSFFSTLKNIIICPSAQTDPSSFRYMTTLISKYSMYNLSKSLPIGGNYIHASLSLTCMVGYSEERSSRDELLIPMSQTQNRTLRSTSNGSLAVPRSKTAIFDGSF